MTGVEDLLEIAVTGKAWMGKGTGSISSMISNSLSAVSREIQVAAYAISENSMDLLDILESILSKDKSVLLVINRLESQPPRVKSRLLEMNDNFEKFLLKDFTPPSKTEDLHAKLIVIDHSIALIGSANLTWKGMILNHEIMVKITGKPAWQIGNLVDKLSKSHDAFVVRKGVR